MTPAPCHIVWDWNSTLLGDADAVLAASNHAFAEFDAANPDLSPRPSFTPLTASEYRALFVRPLERFYATVLCREITEADFRTLEAWFHAKYLTLLVECDLTPGAQEVLASWRDDGGTQSLLSLWEHGALLRHVERFGLVQYFSRIDGRRIPDTTTKTQPLRDHLAALRLDGDVLLIGDALDDAAAAADVGVRCVMYAGGSHDVERLKQTGNPVAYTLAEAISLAAT